MKKPELTILYDNYPLVDGMTEDWGFSLLMRFENTTILFDTGAKGDILLENMKVAGVDPQEIELVFLSHDHWDHQGGLHDLLKANPNIEVVLHSDFSDTFKESVSSAGYSMRVIDAETEILPGMFSTGPMGNGMREHSLVVDLDDETLLVTGCAHPEIDNVVLAARGIFKGKPIRAVGGFHMKGFSGIKIHEKVRRLTALGVERISPCHCSGDQAREVIKEFWLEDCIISGVGGKL